MTLASATSIDGKLADTVGPPYKSTVYNYSLFITPLLRPAYCIFNANIFPYYCFFYIISLLY